jgi:hypothetical protein
MNMRKRSKIEYTNSMTDFYLKPSLNEHKRIYRYKKAAFFDEEIENLKGIISNSLRSSASKSPTVTKAIEISRKFAKFLKTNYSINGKWRSADNILETFNFEKERHFNEFDYCCIFEDSFKLRISSVRVVDNMNKYFEHIKYSLKPKLHIRLTVASRKKN